MIDPVAKIYEAGTQQLIVPLESDSDPAGSAPEFAFAAYDNDDADGATFVAGSWVTTWIQKSGRIDARTPTAGGAGADVPLTAGVYNLFVRWTSGAATPVEWCGMVEVV